MEGELIARASHTHALFRDDNSVVYYYLEEATRGTSYAASIKPFQKVKDGRGARKALTSQYAGKDKWEAEIKRQEQLLHTRIWKGQSNFSLENLISQHRNAYVSMQACAEHVQYQLPKEHSRVGFLLEAIQCSDPGLQAAMASIKTDNGPEGMRNNFEATAAHLLPYDPVAKKRSNGQKRGSAQISSVMDPTPTTTKKPSIGKRVVLEDIQSDDTMISSLALCEKEQMAISSYFIDQDEDINATYGFEDEHQLYHALNMRNEHGQFAMSIGATSILDQPYLDDDDDSQDSSEEDDTSQDDSDDDFDLKELDDDTNEALLDNFMASTAQAGKTRGVDPKHLSKIWRISHEDAQRTIDVTTQTSTRTDDPTLSRNYSTNDRMLRYKRIKDYFFMDTFFATKKGGQSS